MQKLSVDFKKLSEKILFISKLLDSGEPLSVSIGSNETAVTEELREEIALSMAEKYIKDLEELVWKYRKLVNPMQAISMDVTPRNLISETSEPEKKSKTKKKVCKNDGCEGEKYKSNAVCYKCLRKKQKAAKKDRVPKDNSPDEKPDSVLKKAAERLEIDFDGKVTQISVSICEGDKFIYNNLKRCFRGKDGNFYTKEKDPESGEDMLFMVEDRIVSGVTETVIDLKKAVV